MRLCLRVPVPPVQYWHQVDICKSEGVIESRISADRFEAVPPRVVRLNTLVSYYRPNEFKNSLITALCEQRTTV
jgi:hypothetical protein